MGNAISQIYPPKPVFAVEQIPDLAGQIVIVTGGNAGALLSKNAKVYLAARSRPRAEEAIEWLKNETGKEAIFLELDLASFNSIKKATEEFKSKEQELHVLYNNAGVMAPPVELKTAEGYDLQFGTNVLGHFYFTKLLLPALLHTAKNSPLAHGHARIINTSSSAVYIGPRGHIVWDTLGTSEDSDARRKRMGTNVLYAQSKIGNVLFSNELAKQYGDQGIISVSLNPGNLKTELGRHLTRLHIWLLEFILYPASYGALTQLWAGTTPDIEQLNGKFLIPWARIGDAGAFARDEQLAKKLWNWCEEQVKGHSTM
ncbi:short chain dehydrogenase [Ceratobasidium sp. AG-Ba]|nr:short chain dehydrogenase [Ceratobasidium sp. AG-Ba]